MPDHTTASTGAPVSPALGLEPPAALAGAQPGWDLTPFDTAESVFRALTTGPQPLALHGARTAAGLPGRLVPLDELRATLLHPATTAATRNQVWAELVRRAHTGPKAWVVALVAVALPGLRRATARLTPAYRGELADLQNEVLAGFLTAMRALDPDDALEDMPLASRLCWAGFHAGRAYVYADAHHSTGRHPLDDGCAAPPRPWGHPDFVLAAAVTAGVITVADADMVGRNRLEGVPLARIAAERGLSPGSLRHHRAAVEAALAKAIHDGDLGST